MHLCGSVPSDNDLPSLSEQRCLCPLFLRPLYLNRRFFIHLAVELNATLEVALNALPPLRLDASALRSRARLPLSRLGRITVAPWLHTPHGLCK